MRRGIQISLWDFSSIHLIVVAAAGTQEPISLSCPSSPHRHSITVVHYRKKYRVLGRTLPSSFFGPGLSVMFLSNDLQSQVFRLSA